MFAGIEKDKKRYKENPERFYDLCECGKRKSKVARRCQGCPLKGDTPEKSNASLEGETHGD